MARVAADLPRPQEITHVDAKELLADSESPPVDPETGLPKALRAFVVVRDPRITVVPHFFSEVECDHMCSLVEGYWVPSLVGQATQVSDADYSKGNLENTLSTTRTSWSCMIRYAQTSLVERLEHRLVSLAGLRMEQLERMNMVRYAPGELFDEHHDGKFRPKTIFIYLNDLPEDETEGDTFFPVLGVSFKPRRGTAIMWSNNDGENEDSRMLHLGRAPTKAVKYGVNCFFNVKDMRHVHQTGADYDPEEAAVVSLGDLVARSGRPSPKEGEEPQLVAFRLCKDPKVVALPGLLTRAEAEHVLELSAAPASQKGHAACTSVAHLPLEGGTHTVRTLEISETPIVQAIEKRMAAAAGLEIGYLGALRVVKPGTKPGLCNRGCGPKSGYICLSDSDEVFFTRLGMRLKLRKGDGIVWPNVDWETGVAVEDIRTLRVHRGKGAIGLDVFFHDNPVREQQKLRKFVHEGMVASAPAPEPTG